jgi:hypothetical protein
MLNRTVADDQVFAVKQRALDQVESLGELAELSRVLGHELVGWLRHDVSSSRGASAAGLASTRALNLGIELIRNASCRLASG